ncbi:hypothetical protein GCM10027321_00600 [Massilia terrae]
MIGLERPADDTAQLPAPSSGALSCTHWGIIEGFEFNLSKSAKNMEAERINAISALLSDLTGREAELRRYL